MPNPITVTTIILGRELLTYDEIAQKLSVTLGRKIEQDRLSDEDRCQGLVNAGVSKYYTRFLTNTEVASSTRFKTHLNDEVENVTGRPTSSDIFVSDYRPVWV
ncbi:hypothetical protein EYZ11_007793 [Aspergillus tanneri]|uniref:Uncharacterized protein n=1 Tax=Aspergillus tanneri TaxID=1220188 RepID=A0A4S3JC32_9EURO|nr:uncharacterized protein ATNIH1004_009638 [Aspergillus tanneri]KAA8642879.1 hypothetical protein ATNIH1004_009638 [Aspergillus tanneri]THC92716.1 hypothetical protein EYZ11_007793 [Aspergillus tanneri]